MYGNSSVDVVFLIGIVLLVLLTVIVLAGYLLRWDWTGLRGYSKPENQEPSVRLWGWLGLLIVPAAIAMGAAFFAYVQQENNLVVQEKRAQDDGLVAYIDKMGVLLVDNNLGTTKGTGSNESSVARARTLTVLDNADPEHKRRPLQFLYEAGLITSDEPIVSLRKADLSDAKLSWLFLDNPDSVNLEDVFLNRADLSNASLKGAKLANSDLSNGLQEGKQGASLEHADLSHASLRGTLLQNANLSSAILKGADLRPNSEASTKLTAGANLKDAKLEGAKLEGVDLRETKNLTQEQIGLAEGDQDTQLPDNLQQPASWRS